MQILAVRSTESSELGPAPFGELPELTRALRALGSARRGGGDRQAAFFLALLEARRRAQRAITPAERIRAFDVAALSRALDRSIDRILADWPDKRPSARRALRADLGERVASYAVALRALASCADEVAIATEPDRAAAWQTWTAQLSAVFVAADDAWLALRPVVAALPDPATA